MVAKVPREVKVDTAGVDKGQAAHNPVIDDNLQRNKRIRQRTSSLLHHTHGWWRLSSPDRLITVARASSDIAACTCSQRKAESLARLQVCIYLAKVAGVHP